MEVRRRIIWLLLLVLFQPSFTEAGCNVTTKFENYEYRQDVKCTVISLQMNVPLLPLTTHISGYDYKATYVRSIDLSSSTINTVPVGVLQALSRLKLLKMDNASISNIEPGALHGLTQLEELNLDYNNISKIQDGTFDDLGQLKKLYMLGNKLTTLKLLKGLAGLKWLDVDQNNIATIEDDAFKETANLEYLYLSRNKLVDLHADAFAELRHLVILTMSNNRITSIPVGTFRHLGNVTALDISFNNLTHFEFGFFGGLTSLQDLDVSYNNIAVLESKVLFPLISLTRLNLDGNLLSTFDINTMVSYLTTLESISLDRNQIRCELLTSYIYIFRLRDIKVDTGDSFKTKNVHGIYCVSDNVRRNPAKPTNVGVKVTRPLLTTTESTTTSVAPTATVEPTQATQSTTIRIPSTTVLFFTEAPELVDVSTEHLVHTQTMEDHNDHAAVDYSIAQASGTEDEKINLLLKVNSNMHSLIVFTAVAVIVMIILNLLFNMYFIKRNNIENGRNSSSSCAVELLNVTD